MYCKSLHKSGCGALYNGTLNQSYNAVFKMNISGNVWIIIDKQEKKLLGKLESSCEQPLPHTATKEILRVGLYGSMDHTLSILLCLE